MLFNSFHFVFFFIAVTASYFAIPQRFRWALLLAGSCYFYMAFVPVYLLILAFTIIVDYFAGIFIEESKGSKRKLFLLASLAANLGVLAVFKYYNFFNSNITDLLSGFGMENPAPALKMLLPIGLSFHTFQAISYTIEVYRGKQQAERHFGIYALYVMFFPQLVAGPIERPQNLIHQFREKHFFSHDRVSSGLKLMLWGFFKKLVIADRLAIYVNAVYNYPDEFSGSTFILATFFFAFQIYCDFSGYSDIAIGAAKVLGFDLMQNFNRPYFASSVAGFWSRWHISLSTWFRDYVYISLGGNRVPVPRWYLNLFIVFLLSGFWHGANWTFVCWGALNGIFLILETATGRLFKKSGGKLRRGFSENVRKIPAIIFTVFLICMTWVFFRANSIDDAFLIFSRMAAPNGLPWSPGTSYILHCFLGILFLILVESKQEFFPSAFATFNNQRIALRYSVYVFLVLVILLAGVFDGGEFIYFQF